MATGIWISLIGYFALMLAIGFYAWYQSSQSSEGYLLAGRDLGPSVTALSAGAADMSGWLLLGLPGLIFVAGLHEAWMGIGLWVGQLVNWLVVAPRLREQTQRYGNALTIPAFLANRFPSQALILRLVSALVIVVFFVVYTASGLVAGGKLFHIAFPDLLPLGGLSDYQTGVWLTLLIVLIYTAVGGFMAVSLTDFVQGCIMMLALVIMPLVILYGPGGGGLGQAIQTLSRISEPEGYLSWTHGLSFLGWLSAVAWALGYFGQPHIIVRFMAIRSVADVPAARRIGMSWMFISLAGAICMAILGHAYVLRNGLQIRDPETIFIVLSNLLFTPLITGFLYAALLAAVMSTVSSQLLVASSSLVEDCYRLFLNKQASGRQSVNAGRISVVLVGLVAALIARDPDSQVLALVSHAWAGFGAAFGPLILLALLWPGMSGSGAVAGLIAGTATVGGWIGLGWDKHFLGGDGIYEIIPGFVMAGLAICIVSWLKPSHGEYQPANA